MASTTLCIVPNAVELLQLQSTVGRIGTTAHPWDNMAQNAKIAESILKGECTDAKAEAVLLNAGAGIYLMNGASSIAEGIKVARETVASGKAYEKLQEFVKLTNA